MKNPKILLANDLHISKDCIGEFEKNWDEMLEQCSANHIGTCVIGGDLFTSRSSQTLDVLMSVKKCIEKAERCDIKLVIALGNHDMVDQSADFGYPSIFDCYPHVTVVNDQPHFIPLGINQPILAVMRYWNEDTTFPDKLNELVKKLGENDLQRSDVILYIHEGIHGAIGDFKAPLEVEPELFKGFRKVLSGHYHNRTKVEPNIQYIGSSRQHNFGEDEEKGYTILGEDGTATFVKNQVNTRYITFEKDFEELTDEFLGEVADYGSDDYKVRIKVNCTDSQAKTIDKQKWFAAGATKLEMQTEETKKERVTDEDLGKKFDKKGIQSEYETYCNGKNISSELGMKYLNKI